MFAKKRPRPWFVRALTNLAAAAAMYLLAGRFRKYALKMGMDKKYSGKR